MRNSVKILMRRGAYFFGLLGAFLVVFNADGGSSYSFLKHPEKSSVPVAHADTPPVYGQAYYYSEGSYYAEGGYGGDSGSGDSSGGEGCGGEGGCGEGDGDSG